MTTRIYPLSIEEHGGPEIARVARLAGATHLREIGCGPRGGEPDQQCVFYAFRHRGGHEVRCASTNGNPVWEDEDPAAFAGLADECGVALD